MPSVLERLPEHSRVAVIRLRSLGDCVLSTPALDILKRTRPDLRVGVVVEERFRAVFEGNADVADLLPPEPGALSDWRADLVVNFHGGTRSMMLTAASVARLRAGFAHHTGAWVYNVRIPRAQEILGEERVVHTAEHLASAMFYLGAPRVEIPRAKLSAGPVQHKAPYAVLHPFAAAPEKTWPAARFVEVASALEREGLEPVILAGPGDDTAPFAGYQIFRQSLAEVKSLLSGATLFIGNDSGPAHMAAAFGVPVVVLFGPSDPTIWAPWRTESQVLVSRDSIERIEVEQVLGAVERLQVAR